MTEEVSIFKFPSQVFKVLKITRNNKNKITEASASVNLLLFRGGG